MTIDEIVDTSLSSVLANTWSVDQPEAIWPAVVFEIESEDEKNWVLGAKRTQHVVTVHLMSTSKLDFETYLPQIRAVMEAVTGYMGEEGSGDAEYEELPDVYGKYIDFRIRTTS